MDLTVVAGTPLVPLPRETAALSVCVFVWSGEGSACAGWAVERFRQRAMCWGVQR